MLWTRHHAWQCSSTRIELGPTHAQPHLQEQHVLGGGMMYEGLQPLLDTDMQLAAGFAK